jgi:uncharacterized cupredoxin-like copper-binding protein
MYEEEGVDIMQSTSIAVPLFASGAMFAASAGLVLQSDAHENHSRYSAGEPGDANKPARTITVKMREEGKRMMFEPPRIEVRKGEQIRFVLQNEGDETHEFVLATTEENRKHAQLMKKYPEMAHDDPNARRVPEYLDDELLWRFTKRGEFEYACLISGHYEKGMFGKVIVK